QPSERSARRIARPIPSVLASDATPRCASMASADRQMIGDATLGVMSNAVPGGATVAVICECPVADFHRMMGGIHRNRSSQACQ
ncbi:hypothetical protein D8B29_25830, partial [Verminephrobacter eiseniae]|nr:hypothetical protein [Verminephrobacter eiseniae]